MPGSADPPPPPQKMPIHQDGSTKKRNRDDRTPAQKKKQITPTNQQRSSISLTDLPSNALVEILARLPLGTLFVARSVCKTLGFLSTPNPHFIKLHSSNAAQIPIFQFGDSDLPSRIIHMADNLLSYKKSQPIPLFRFPIIDGTLKQYNLTYIGDISRPGLVNSCNRLLYFRQLGLHNSLTLSLVCNPVTSEYIIIPEPKKRTNSWIEGVCLGFSPAANQYKVLRVFSWNDAAGLLESAAQVFVIGSDSWRDVADTPLCRGYFGWYSCGTNVNGLMYWKYGGLWPRAIISFDFEREKFEEVALPLELQDEKLMSKHETSIGVLGGCLCLGCNNFDAHRVDLWVMRKSGNQDSWTKDFVINTLRLGVSGRPVYGQFKPLQFIGNGEILMQWTLQQKNRKENTLVCYDPRTVTLTYFVLGRVEQKFKVMALTPSFVPLKEALNVDEVWSGLRPKVIK